VTDGEIGAGHVCQLNEGPQKAWLRTTASSVFREPAVRKLEDFADLRWHPVVKVSNDDARMGRCAVMAFSEVYCASAAGRGRHRESDLEPVPTRKMLRCSPPAISIRLLV